MGHPGREKPDNPEAIYCVSAHQEAEQGGFGNVLVTGDFEIKSSVFLHNWDISSTFQELMALPLLKFLVTFLKNIMATSRAACKRHTGPRAMPRGSVSLTQLLNVFISIHLDLVVFFALAFA